MVEAAERPPLPTLPKTGLLSGLAPPPHIIDGSPLVEHEADRLQEAMTWVYKSVRTLQQQGPTVDSRLASIQELLQGMAETNNAVQTQLATISSRVIKLEDQSSHAIKKAEEAEQHRGVDQRHVASEIQRVQKDMQAMLRYIGGVDDSVPQVGEEPLLRTGSKGELPLAWLERRIEGLIAKEGGKSLETRLANLEKDGASDLSRRLKKIEQDFRLLDVQDLGKVRPDLTDYQKQQEEVSGDLAREMKELKVLVGCVEACIPRETRKAVDLFKRAAGSSANQEPSSPREFAMEGKILALREEMESQIQGAADSLKSGRDHMTIIVKGLEKKQEMLESHMEEVRRTNRTPPQAATQQGASEVGIAPVGAPESGDLRL